MNCGINKGDKETKKMGLFGDLIGAIGEGIVEGFKDVNSNENTWHSFTSSVTGDIKEDSQYMEVFKEALAAIRKKRPEDTYIKFCSAGTIECAAMIAGCVPNDGINGKDRTGHLVGWRVYCGKPWDEKLSFKLRLLTPNALQKGADGKPLKKIDEYKTKVVGEGLLKRRSLPKLTSFLGVNFGDDYKKFAVGNAGEVDQKTGLIAVPAKTNQLFEFTSYYIIKPFDGDNVIGVACKVDKENVDNEFVSRVIAVLEEKYKRNCRVQESWMSWGYHMEKRVGSERDSLKMNKMIFFEDEAKNLNPTHEILVDQANEICITAIDVVAAQKAKSAYHDETARKKAQEEAEKVRKDAKDRSSALDAL